MSLPVVVVFISRLSHPLCGAVEVQSQLKPLLSLLSSDAELFPDPVQPGESVSGRACGAAQRLAENYGGLKQLPPVIVGALSDRNTRERCY